MQNYNEGVVYKGDFQSLEKNVFRINSSDTSNILETKEQTLKISRNFEINDDKSYRTGKWSIEEHQKFLQACKTYGNNWFKVKIF